MARSEQMHRVGSKDTRPEMIVRRLAHRLESDGSRILVVWERELRDVDQLSRHLTSFLDA